QGPLIRPSGTFSPKGEGRHTGITGDGLFRQRDGQLTGAAALWPSPLGEKVAKPDEGASP
ncbi:MAG TPA: hypothetical protein VFE52_03380, partial [Devosia sp.]|nr:hypothetical protein [Devosia sp.]